MRTNYICIDLKNIEQVRWWNKTGHKFAKVVDYNTIVETATNKPIAYICELKGPFVKWVVKQNNKFIEDAVTTVIDYLKD